MLRILLPVAERIRAWAGLVYDFTATTVAIIPSNPRLTSTCYCNIINDRYPVNMPDLIRKISGYGHYGQRAARIGLERICQVWLPTSVPVPFFQRRHGPYCAKLTRIGSGWSGQGLAKYIRSGSKPVCGNHQARLLAGRNRPSTSFHTFRLGSALPQTSRIILCKTSPGPI